MESEIDRRFLALGYRTKIDGADLLSPDGSEVYEIKLGGRGTRDIRDAALRLATFLARHPGIIRGYVLASLIRISTARLQAEWDSIKQVLLPEVSARMHLVAVVDGIVVGGLGDHQPTPVITQFLELAKDTPGPSESRSYFFQEHNARTGNALGASWKHLEVEKILLHRWLLNEGPIAVGALSRQVGCSYPTAIQAIRRLSANELITRKRKRSVSLARYPRDRWAELLRSQRLIYPPEEFVSPITEPNAVSGILRRLNRLRPKGVAVGGTVAARRWDPTFDLNGTPRIDVILHTPLGSRPSGGVLVYEATEFVRRLDPALKRRSSHMKGTTVLVLHHMFRQNSLFLEEPQSPIPWADPVEVLCHLNDLGLTSQAGDLLRRLHEDGKS